MIKGSIHQEAITLVNKYAPNIGAPKYIKQLLTDIKGKINSNTLIVRDFNYPIDTNGQIFQAKNQQRSNGPKRHTRPDGFNKYFQSILSQSNKIYILLKSTWNIF